MKYLTQLFFLAFFASTICYSQQIKKYSDPIDEFLDNHITIYSVKSYSNSRKIELKIKIPKSWSELDANSPNALKKFRSENGKGNEIITVTAKKISNGKQGNSLTIHNFYSERELLKMVPEGSKILAINTKKVNNNRIGILQYEETNPKIGSGQKRYIIQYLLIVDKNLVQVTCATYGAKGDRLDEQFEKYQPLYESIMKSLLTTEVNVITYKM